MNGLRNKKMRTAGSEQPSGGVGSGAMSQGMPAAAHDAHVRNGATQAPMHAVAAAYGAVHRGRYAVDYRAVVQPGAAMGYAGVHGEMVVGDAREHGMDVGGAHGGGGRGGRVGGRAVDGGGMEAKKPR